MFLATCAEGEKRLKKLEKALGKEGIEFRPESYKWSCVQARKQDIGVGVGVVVVVVVGASSSGRRSCECSFVQVSECECGAGSRCVLQC